MSAIARLFGGLKKGARNFGETIAIIVNSALLLFVYLVGIGLTSLIAKLSGKKFLGLDAPKDEQSCWSDLNLKDKPMEEYYRQF